MDFTWALSHFLTVTGDALWADKMEKAIYNAGLGSVTKDFRSLQYFSSLNQFIATGTSNHNKYKHGSTWMAYRPTHETECCSGNVNRMLPNFVGRMWLTDADGGAVAALYGPNTASFSTEKGQVSITCDTNYPFDEHLTFTVDGDEGASIPLTLRIPTWCEGASVSVNGKAVNIALQAGAFVRQTDPVKPGDVVEMILPMTVERGEREGQGVWFECGPLLFAYPIPQQKTEDTTEYENMHGKKPENPDFKCWNITPTGDFNYAYAADGQPMTVQATGVDMNNSFPFDLDAAPLKLRVPVKRIEWALEDDRYTPRLPEQGHLTFLSDAVSYIDLVPYGCTELRLTVFPDADGQPLPPEPEKIYSRPADAPDCVEALDDCYYAYFLQPRFCWDDPIYCKVRTADDTTTDLYDTKNGDPCTLVGTAADGRKIWRWKGVKLSEKAPVHIIFTNNDVLTDIMEYRIGGVYDHSGIKYVSESDDANSITRVVSSHGVDNDALYDLQGRQVNRQQPLKKGVYIQRRKKVVLAGE